MSGKVFVDSSAYFALLNVKERRHADAVTIMNRLADQDAELYTSNFVLAEAHALLLKKLGYAAAAAFLHALDASTTHLVRITLADERRAREIIGTYTDKEFSYADATSFALMERLHIREAFSFDGDFAQYGFVIFTS